MCKYLNVKSYNRGCFQTVRLFNIKSKEIYLNYVLDLRGEETKEKKKTEEKTKRRKNKWIMITTVVKTPKISSLMMRIKMQWMQKN